MSASSEALKFGCCIGEFSFPACFPGLMAISLDRVIYLRVRYMPHSEYWQYVYIVHSILCSALFNKIYLLYYSVQLSDQIMPDKLMTHNYARVFEFFSACMDLSCVLHVCHVGGTFLDPITWVLSCHTETWGPIGGYHYKGSNLIWFGVWGRLRVTFFTFKL